MEIHIGKLSCEEVIMKLNKLIAMVALVTAVTANVAKAEEGKQGLAEVSGHKSEFAAGDKKNAVRMARVQLQDSGKQTIEDRTTDTSVQ